MSALRRFVKKAADLARRGRFSGELEEEMAFHREQMESELRTEGMSEDEARYAALRQFGNDADERTKP